MSTRSPPPVVRTTTLLRDLVAGWRRDGLSVALVPTMGALHAGHAALVTAARKAADRVVTSIFVNPTQFGPGEDFARYPRDENADRATLARAGCDLVYAPAVAAVYPPNFATSVRVAGLTDMMEGAVRPGHFDGVATVVAKLLIGCAPDVAFFGEKDWQQLAVIRRIVADLDLPVRVVGHAIVRDTDGLALSSRNAYLSPHDRVRAGALPAMLAWAAEAIAAGDDPARALTEARAALLAAGFDTIDYLDLRDADTLAPRTTPGRGPARLLVAARLGGVRLIDNMAVGTTTRW